MKKMRIKHFTLFVSLLCYVVQSHAQERIVELSTNARVIQQNQDLNIGRAPNSLNQFWVYTPISILPFQDDFSRVKNTNYNRDDYPASAKSDTLWYNYKINGALPSTVDLYYMIDTSYTFTFNATDNTVSKVANSPFQLTFFQNKLAPNTITLAKEFWPAYDSISYNTTTLQPDTFFIQPDTLITFLSDTLYYTKLAAGEANWKNRNVFWNDNYPVNPPSIGVVTFDGIDSTGYPYNFNIQTAQGKADVLNSVPFDFSLFTPVEDSIHFSFYYQSTGRGNKPEPEDSLQLEFKARDGSWKRVWGKAGYALTTDSLFSRTVIAIKDTIFYHKSFEFRFTNYATLSGNLDHWHIDYVRLDLDADTIIKDITWVYPGKSVFSRYQEIPRKQYNSASADFFKNYVRNLFNQSINVSYALRVKDYFNNSIFSIDVNNVDFAPLVLNSCTFCNQILNPLASSTFSFPITSLCARYEVGSVIQNIAAEPNTANDTLYYTQVFGDCFAYDDGSAEAAYGVTSPFAQMAVKFTAITSDTLKAIRIYFNPVVVNAAEFNQFNLVVWNEDPNGKPGNELYRSSTPFSPQYSYINGFVDFPLSSTLIVPGNFFIGLEQNGASELNIGIDRNTNAMDMQYYQTTGTWYLTQFKGSWMIRPVFGACQDFLSGVEETSPQNEEAFVPNPANDIITFKANLNDIFEIKMFDARGVLVVDQKISSGNEINLQHLSEGIYYINMLNASNGKVSHQKLVLIKP
jgi:hypothetical protein